MKIAIGSDHAGFELKKVIVAYLKEQKLDVHDLGCQSLDSVDYPDYAEKVAKAVSEGESNQGILICGTGIGMSIMANKFSGVRAALVHDSFGAKMSRAHTDANILVLGSKFVKKEDIPSIMKEWFSSTFEGGRHERRVGKIRKAEKEN